MSKTSTFMRYGLVIVLATVSAVWFLPAVSSQGVTDKETDNKIATVAVNAKGRGFPRVNFEDGREIFATGENANGSSGRAMVSGDFDSDGTADLMTVDTGGVIRFYKGNVDSIYPKHDQNQKEPNAAPVDPFFPSSQSFNVPVAPDYFEAGDFNADGKIDLLVAAKGGDRLYVLTGNGAGGFAHTTEFTLGGSVTALAAGEIGSQDGQTDVAVAVETGKGSMLLIFEHPEGAFVHTPEFIRLPSKSNNLAIGHLDTDFFGDIAVSSGNRLTIVRGRGQAYPWDRMPEYGVERPAAIVDSRAMPFDIVAITTGYFTEKRGQSLAMLTSTGTIQTLDSPAAEKAPARLNLKADKGSFPAKESGKALGRYKLLQEFTDPTSDHESTRGMYRMENGVQVPLDLTEPKPKELTQEQEALVSAGGTNIEPAARQKTRDNFLRSISPTATAPLTRWEMRSIASDPKLASAASSVSTSKLVRVRVSDSGRDELAFVDPTSNQVHLMLRENIRRNSNAVATEIISLDAQTAPVALLPMRLNMDAVSDLVILREGAESPSIVMTSPAATFLVTTAADEDDGSCGASCSLREAIKAANTSAGVDTINFNIPGQTIQPQTDLPRINFPVTINGPVSGPTNQPQVEISGDLGEEGDNGLSINAPNVVVRGLAINSFITFEQNEGENTGGSAISIFNFAGETDAQFCIIEGNYLGTDRTGAIDRGNEQAGLFIFDSDNNVVGGTATAARNVMSGNGNGEVANGDRFAPGITIIDGNFTIVQGNYVGVTASGSTRLANSSGIFISGGQNQVGGDAAGSGNVVSGNTHSSPSNFDPQGCFGGGISEAAVIDLDTGENITKNGLYQGNLLGVNAAGNAAMSNCRTGFFTSPRNTATVGSITTQGRNTVSGNTDGGLWCSTRPRGGGILRPSEVQGVGVVEGFCRIIGNNVGTDVNGNFAIPNDHSHGDQTFFTNGALVVYNTATFSTIGGRPGTSPNSCTGHCNLTSGNGSLISDGLGGINAMANEGDIGIWNNYAGTNKNGTAGIPNYAGIYASGNVTVGGILTESGTDFSLGNLVSGNKQNGMVVGGGSSAATQIAQIRGNLVGTDRTGISAVPNNTALNPFAGAVYLTGADVVIVGGTHALARNVISGNNGNGIQFFNAVLTAPTVNNYIGVNINGDPLGNSQDGVWLDGNFDYLGDNSVGNVIANNGRNGIYVRGSTARGNRFRYNSIYNNGALGIDLTGDITLPVEPDGVTPNDCDDADTGPNKLQNYPILTTPVFNGDGTVTVGGAFGSEASQTYTLDFYSNSTADPSNYGEGETYIGSKSVTTDDSGRTAFLFTSTVQVTAGLKITATASDIDGNTSEFSCFAGQCSVTGDDLTEQESAMRIAGGGCSIGFVVNINTDEPDPNPADGICDVDLNTVGEQCSLRAAIQTTNAIAGTDFVYFNIPGGGIQTILVLSDLPPITEKVYINATFQPGYAGTPVVEVNGAATSITSNGFVFAAGSDNSKLMGLTINRFGDSGVLIQANDVEVTKCYIGIFADGMTEDPAGKQRRGVLITGARNTIGGERDAAEPSTGSNNLLVGNSVEQIKIIGTSAVGNTVLGNSIGFTLSDTERSRLSEADGIVLDTGSSGNHVGGNGDIMLRNVIQGQIAVMIRESDGNFVNNNGIGNSAAGVAIFQGANNTIGGLVRSENEYTDRNLIANNIMGIFLSDFFEIPAEFTRNSPDVDDKDCKGVADERKKRANSRRPSAGGTIRTTGNKILGNLIGIRSQDDPIDDYSNCVGVVISEASGNFVGANEEGYLNFISGNKEGGIIIDHLGTQNTVQRNYIGTKRTGTESHPNLNGVDIAGNVNFVRNNIIAGNTERGVTIERHVESDAIPTGNVVENNRIGLSLNDVMLPQEKGVYVQGIGNTIQNNNISGNSIAGIDILGDSNSILNNLIGTDRTGNEARPNTEFGILITSSNNTVSGNTISGNGSGVTIIRPVEDPKIEASGNRILGNYIGTNSTGTTALPGQTHGVAIANGADNNTIGGTTAGSRNVISANTQVGISIQPGPVPAASAPFRTKIQGNYIGTNAAGTAAIPNGIIGIEISETLETLIGGFGADMPGARNVISGNSQHGILLRSNTLNTRISGNYIGTASDGASPLGNIGNGIFLQRGVGRTTIGGQEPNAGNTIAYNGKNGILMAVDAGQNNIIDPNTIFANALMGIDIGDDGHTPNDVHDPDTGPNNLQNYPDIVSKQIVGNALIVGFKVDSAPTNSAYGTNGIYVEFFKADTSGEGEKFLGFGYYTVADYNGGSPQTKMINLGDLTILGITASDPITATATDANGNTSEFTPLAPTAAGITVAGRVTAAGRGVRGASVSMTNSEGVSKTVLTGVNGAFIFEDVEPGMTYVIRVVSRRFQFAPRVLQVNDNVTDVEIVAGEF